MTVGEQAAAARRAARRMASLSDAVRRGALLRAADALGANAARIVRANAEDITRADQEGLARPLRGRLRFDEKKLSEAAEGLRALAALEDPIGRTQLATELSPGLELYRVSCPIGVIGFVFESRPDALVQIAGLCVRSGNACLLKGGREALETNRALFDVIDGAVRAAGVPGGWGALLETREDVGAMLALSGDIDLIIPRGSNAFVRHIIEHSRIPVLGHADGICHVYIDRAADLAMAEGVVVDSKTQYPAVCNAAETLLVHRDIAAEAIGRLAGALAEKGVALRGDARARAIHPMEMAEDADWDTEYLDLILSVRVVDSIEDAIAHIGAHGSGHTDAIVTDDAQAARRFLGEVDSAGVYWNCSTRFADGFRYGFGAEVGVATGKLHARGPMGMEGLCTYKYKLLGSGQTVGAGEPFTHRKLDKACPLDGDGTQ